MTLLAAKERPSSAAATIDEHIAARVLSQRDRLLGPTSTIGGLDWDRRHVDPGGTVIELVPGRSGGVARAGALPRPGRVDAPGSTARCSPSDGTYVGPGHWSSSTTDTSGSATAGPPMTSSTPAWLHSTAAGEQLAR